MKKRDGKGPRKTWWTSDALVNRANGGGKRSEQKEAIRKLTRIAAIVVALVIAVNAVSPNL